MRNYLFLFSLLLVTAPTAAEIYKWVDEEGNVHYSQQRPPADAQPRSTETLKVNSGSASEADLKNLQRDIERSNKIFEDRAQKKEEQEQAAAEQDIRKQNCDKVRLNLQKLQEAQRIYHTDEQGNRTRIGEEQRQADIKRAQEQVEEWCK
jgi:hypothetical protein